MKRFLCFLFCMMLFACSPTVTREVVTITPAEHPDEGTQAVSVVLENAALDTPDKLNRDTVAFTLTSQTVGKSVVNSVWTSRTGGVVARCRTEKLTTGIKFTFDITNSLAGQVTQADFRLPTFNVPLDRDNAIYSPYRGGREVLWPMDDWNKGTSNSSVWPGTAFSPILSVWNKRTLDTVAITFFNDSLTPAMLYWASGPAGVFADRQGFNPFLRCFPRIEPGQSFVFLMEYRFMKGGPAAHWAYYRSKVLAPFMARMGIPEASGDLGPGPIATDARTDGDIIASNIQAAEKAGASAYIQWSGGDGRSKYFNPYPARSGWFNGLATPHGPGIRIGCLINPFVSPPMASDNVALQSNGLPDINLHINHNADDVRTYDITLARELARRGVTCAFWDTGGQPDAMSGQKWLRELYKWKRQGIAVMPETSCDVAAWTTGLWMEFQYGWGDFKMTRAICPRAAYSVLDHSANVRNGISWREDAKAKGIRPIIDVQELSAAATLPR